MPADNLKRVNCQVFTTTSKQHVVLQGGSVCYHYDPLHALILADALRRAALACDPQLAHQRIDGQGALIQDVTPERH